MLRLDKGEKKLHRLEARKMADVGLLEYHDVQQMIRHSASDFFDELDEKLVLIGEEVRPATFVDDRIDLLAVDPQGTAVVIELKRGTNKLQLLQALAYAGMVAKWKGEQLIQHLANSSNTTQEEAREELEQFLEEDTSSLNQSQRVILLAEDFDYEVLVTAEWLTEKYDVDIRCYRLALSTEAGIDFLTCTCIYPPPELTDTATRRGTKGSAVPPIWPDWKTAIDEIENPAVSDFFRQEIAAGREGNLKDRSLRWLFDDKRRFRIRGRLKYAVVKQYGRFENDEAYWTKELGSDIKPRVLDHGANLRFLIDKMEQFGKFMESMDELKDRKFAVPGEEQEGEE